MLSNKYNFFDFREETINHALAIQPPVMIRISHETTLDTWDVISSLKFNIGLAH